MNRRGAAWIVAMLLPMAPAVAGDPPKLKEGLWQIRGESVENPGANVTQFAYKLCRDHAYDKAANALLENVKGCKTVLKDLGGGKLASSSTCQVEGTTIVSSGLTTFISDQSTHADTQATYTPAFNGKTDETMREDQQYVGACPSGMKAGEIIGPDGVIRHHP